MSSLPVNVRIGGGGWSQFQRQQEEYGLIYYFLRLYKHASLSNYFNTASSTAHQIPLLGLNPGLFDFGIIRSDALTTRG
jgi:hypothetical protein